MSPYSSRQNLKTENVWISENGHYCKLKLITLTTILKSEFRRNHSEAQKPGGKIRVRNLPSVVRTMTAEISVYTQIKIADLFLRSKHADSVRGKPCIHRRWQVKAAYELEERAADPEAETAAAIGRGRNATHRLGCRRGDRLWRRRLAHLRTNLRCSHHWQQIPGKLCCRWPTNWDELKGASFFLPPVTRRIRAQTRICSLCYHFFPFSMFLRAIIDN